VASPAAAYRPFDGTDAGVADKGDLELEIGPVGYIRSNRQSFFAPLEILNLGFAEGWELVAQGRPVIPGERSKLSLADTQLTAKHVLVPGFLQGKSGPGLATEFGPLFPTIGGERGAGGLVAAIFSHEIGSAVFHWNVQATRLRDGNGDLFAGLISECPRSWFVRPVSEIFVEREFGETTTVSGLVGFIARISEHYDLDAATRIASVDGRELFEVRAGFTWSYGLW
jgi:hypothetical protein